MKIAILTREDYRSPRVLAESLKIQFEEQGVYAEIFAKISLLNRLVSFRESKLSFHFWLQRKLTHFFSDLNLLKKLRKFDAVVISECSPNGFWKRQYNVEKFKTILCKPVLFYEVYFLGNAPTQIKTLKKNGDALLERFDFHLSVSSLNEIKLVPSTKWYPIGIYGKSWNLFPKPKEEILAIVDFAHPGNEHYRDVQIRALKRVGIKYLLLEQSYSFTEIREIYNKGALYFMQSSEAFGIPILECLCCGCQIFTQSSAWPMSWRLDDEPVEHGPGLLPDCFTIYTDENNLVTELMHLKKSYDLVESPKEVFARFMAHYPFFYYGNKEEINRLLNNIAEKN